MAKKPKYKTKGKATNAKNNKPAETIREEALAAVLSSINQSVLVKVCRLCESKDGPFLHIFSADKVLSKKMQELLPFVVDENDGLPHKICFRCSAKVEELHEFIQKCVKTQYSLNKSHGLKDELVLKTNRRKMWEEKLNKSNLSNDDICDLLVKKAMEGITDLDVKLETNHKPESALSKEKEKPIVETVPSSSKEIDAEDNDCKLMKEEILVNKTRNSKQQDQNLSSKATRSSKDETSNNQVKFRIVAKNRETKSVDSDNEIKSKKETVGKETDTNEKVLNKEETNITVNRFQMDYVDLVESSSEKKEEKIFDIMDHVTSIKVNGVGFLFQCKLCNRNFLKREVVLSHACAKTGIPKIDYFKSVTNVEPPKNTQPNIKFITNKVPDPPKPVEDETPKQSLENETLKEVPPLKTKPKIGPASKVKKSSENSVSPLTSTNSVSVSTPSQTITIASSLMQVPTVQIPGMGNRFKLVPGPNNSFTLVEDTSMPDPSNTPQKPEDDLPKPASIIDLGVKSIKRSKRTVDRKRLVSNEEVIDLEDDSTPQSKGVNDNTTLTDNLPPPPPLTKLQPYPVGLFQTIPGPQPQASFTTPAMKKQSYTVVQTGDPSKLVISTKTQVPPKTLEPTATSKPKRSRKAKLNPKDDKQDQPFNVTIEDATRQQPFNSQIFSFVNVDPLLQPSYVLPTNNIIQESQITTSTPVTTVKSNKDVYACHLCTEIFTVEKKYLAHIQIHYGQAMKKDEVGGRKRTRRS